LAHTAGFADKAATMCYGSCAQSLVVSIGLLLAKYGKRILKRWIGVMVVEDECRLLCCFLGSGSFSTNTYIYIDIPMMDIDDLRVLWKS